MPIMATACSGKGCTGMRLMPAPPSPVDGWAGSCGRLSLGGGLCLPCRRKEQVCAQLVGAQAPTVPDNRSADERSGNERAGWWTPTAAVRAPGWCAGAQCAANRHPLQRSSAPAESAQGIAAPLPKGRPRDPAWSVPRMRSSVPGPRRKHANRFPGPSVAGP